MFFIGSAWATFLLCLLVYRVSAQASSKNPLIWEILVQYDLARSNNSQTYLPDTSSKVYSQDFQTVFSFRDLYGHNERLVIDMGDGCSQTTIQDIDRLNGGTTTSPSMMSQPSFGLVQRGGRCKLWSEKISTIQSLSDAHNLDITGVLIYDDILYDDTHYIKENTSDASYPTWPSTTLPDERNISLMTDENQINLQSTFVAVYFIPRSYANYLNETFLRQTLQTNTAKQTYLQLTFSLQESSFITYSKPGTSSNTSSDDNARDDIWGNVDKRNYIIYTITAVVVVLLGIILFRWCRAIRQTRPNQHDIEHRHSGILLEGLNYPLNGSLQVIPFMELDKLCRIVTYGEATMTNNVCAICLEDFKNDSFVRVLPCHHGYCTACIDVWLTKKSSQCPICKYNCHESNESETKPENDENTVVSVDRLTPNELIEQSQAENRQR